MQTEQLGKGYESVGELGHSKELFLSQGKLWLFGLNFKNQPNFCFGNHVVHIGSSVLAYSLENNSWERIEFNPVSEEENLSEVLFTFQDSIYLILFQNFEAIEFKSLYKWTGKAFENVPLKAAPAIEIEKQVRISAVKASGTTSDSEVVIVTNGEGMRVFKLTIGNDGAQINLFTSFREEPSPMAGTAVSGAVMDNKLVIGYGVQACGFRWLSNEIITVDLNTKEVKDVKINDAEEGHPHFCFSGARAHSVVNKQNGWAHVSGSVQVGMTGNKFDGSVWILKNAFGEPEWEKINGEIPESDVFVDDNVIYSVNKDEVNKFTIL